MQRRQFLKLSALASLSFLTAAQADWVETTLSRMTLPQKVGQLFMLSLPGTRFTEDMRRLIYDYHIGGMAFFSYNVSTPETLTELTNEIQAVALAALPRVPLLLAVDQEGGRVQRLNQPPFSLFPNPMALGAANDPDLTRRVAEAIAEELLACGFNMNLAPVLDVNTDSANTVINVRSFGADPERVALHGKAFIEGTQSKGIIATGKHFPGHGSTSEDSHYTLPVVTLDHSALLKTLQPFQESISANVGAMMTAHIVYPALDGRTAATFSAPIMTDLLRQEFGFQGVVMSDALTMEAIRLSRDNPLYVFRDALYAGVDLLTYGARPDGSAPSVTSQIEALELMLALAESELVEVARIDRAVHNILSLKAHFNLQNWQPLGVGWAADRLNSAAHQQLIMETAQKSITLVRDAANLLPLHAFTVLYPASEPQFLDVFPGAVAYSPSPSENEAALLARQIGDQPAVCFTMDAHKNPGQVALINALDLSKTVVVAAQSPYDVQYFPLVPTYLLMLGISPSSLQAVRE
ncbi:MAG: beta-N-acetylhexosaminidase, partial [Anaerolineae bacterium]|nr:beta-N-acetylhexosaminidase [Anaerolineae bacterium]